MRKEADFDSFKPLSTNPFWGALTNAHKITETQKDDRVVFEVFGGGGRLEVPASKTEKVEKVRKQVSRHMDSHIPVGFPSITSFEKRSSNAELPKVLRSSEDSHKKRGWVPALLDYFTK